MAEVHAVINLLILLAGALMLVMTSRLLATRSGCWPIVGPLWFWAIHLTIMYSVLIVGDITGKPLFVDEALEIWSSIQRLHGIITMFFMTYLLSLGQVKQ